MFSLLFIFALMKWNRNDVKLGVYEAIWKKRKPRAKDQRVKMRTCVRFGRNVAIVMGSLCIFYFLHTKYQTHTILTFSPIEPFATVNRRSTFSFEILGHFAWGWIKMTRIYSIRGTRMTIIRTPFSHPSIPCNRVRISQNCSQFALIKNSQRV